MNTAEHVRPGGLLAHHGPSSVREDFEQSCLGFVHLARAFGPVMRMRGADGVDSAVAWVNVLSVDALANWSGNSASETVRLASIRFHAPVAVQPFRNA